MRRLLLCFYILIILLINSCDMDQMDQKEYVSIYIVNHTEESIIVYTGFNVLFISIPSTTIPTGSGQSVLAEKGNTVDVYGKNSDKKYGSRTFYFETQWDIY